MNLKRAAIEAEIERLLTILDGFDGDPDLEEEPFEEQHDQEAEVSWTSGIAPEWFVLAENGRRKKRRN
ncbi:hypothetical protein [Oryzicola mucosus]|uniref:Uncharacterized protein n=1 Tax=Oryzicola mucosus TaxID=2767425 RepID=A0A8J6U344_9HYPH|nr:hypothetical protein [Oryzicola mucosus]MBD0416128.1 hypothetical protein [Oryzicola mucosus]